MLLAGFTLNCQLSAIASSDPDLASLSHRLTRTGITGPVSENEVQILTSGTQTFSSLNYHLHGAQSSIYFASYIFHSDFTGQGVARLLARKASEGLDVRLFLDAWGSLYFTEEMEKELRDAGVKIVYFRPFEILRPYRHLLRNHRRLIIIDGKLAMTGGLAIQDAWADMYPENEIQDIQLWLKGPLVRELSALFMEDWCAAAAEQSLEGQPQYVRGCQRNMDRAPLTATELSSETELSRQMQRPDLESGETSDPDIPETTHACDPDRARCRARTAILATGPGRRSRIHRFYLEAMEGARIRIWLVTPYFIPDGPFMQSLKRALHRGLDVRLVMASSETIEEFPVIYVRNPYVQEFLEAGGRVFVYQKSFLHSKAAIFDDSVSVIGTSNLDRRSFDYNHEVDIVSYASGINASLSAVFLRYMKDSKEITLEDLKNRSAGTRCLELFWWPLTPQL
ncbi:MAG: hypothetical protein KDK23_02365 [Leptospiraceae bacterium]|nr:hypothetical protein [Leptospiraceae bacterium]